MLASNKTYCLSHYKSQYYSLTGTKLVLWNIYCDQTSCPFVLRILISITGSAYSVWSGIFCIVQISVPSLFVSCYSPNTALHLMYNDFHYTQTCVFFNSSKELDFCYSSISETYFLTCNIQNIMKVMILLFAL